MGVVAVPDRLQQHCRRRPFGLCGRGHQGFLGAGGKERAEEPKSDAAAYEEEGEGVDLLTGLGPILPPLDEEAACQSNRGHRSDHHRQPPAEVVGQAALGDQVADPARGGGDPDRGEESPDGQEHDDQDDGGRSGCVEEEGDCAYGKPGKLAQEQRRHSQGLPGSQALQEENGG